MKLLKNTLAHFAFRVRRRSSYLLIFLNGFLLASMAYFYVEDSYEQKVFDSLAGHIRATAAKGPGTNETEELIRTSLSLTNFLGQGRMKIFEGYDLNSIKSEIIHPVTFDLMTGKGACGSYSYILSRLLTELKIPNRIAQMQVDGNFGGHNIVEAKSADGWVVLDPLYNLYFVRQDGKLASFADVQHDWNYYKSQVPQGYDGKYNYADVRYTNWTKLPLVMPAVKKVMEWTMGEQEVKTFSLRTHMLKKFSILFYTALVFYIFTLFITIKKFIRHKKQARMFDPTLLFPKRSGGSMAPVQSLY